MIITIKGTEVAAGVGTGNASNIGSARLVRCANAGGTARLVTLEESGGTDIGTFTVPANGVQYVRKEASDELFAAHADIKFAACTQN
jgi:hypothetical protein|tara:strand:- start:1236 stop:1496 length:261 start_codon:yes stop_codon:yes gene_type:complete